MTLSALNLVVLLVGLFGVPVALLQYGHRLRRRSLRFQRAFRGALAGHCLAGTIAIFAAMLPPEAWTSAEMIRGVLGIWGMLALPVLGCVAGLVRRFA